MVLLSEEWLIDGYNLLHDLIQKNKKSKISRENLFGLLASFAATGNHKILMVLDGRGNDEELEAYKTKFFHAVYSQSVSADAYIERCLCEKQGQSQLKVVTKDRALSDIARGFGAIVVEPRDFMERVYKKRQESGDALFKSKVAAHGFHRPFKDKLKDNP